ncbi:MAG: hypothetical protein PHI53_00410 [Candidatus Pacebacteria bacterium]|nr:hypothetical protein [Candidatus Paceibacterota bacterium]
MLFIYILIFILSCFLLFFSGSRIIKSLINLAVFLNWREFVVAFFVMAFAASLPNLFVGITSALNGIPQLSFGDVAGNNIVALTLAVAFASFFSKKGGGLMAKSKAIQTTSFFTIISAVMPFLLISDGELSRLDGIILIGFFFLFVFWLFSKKERFIKFYKNNSGVKDVKFFLKDLINIILGLLILILSAQGIVISAKFISISLNLSIVLVGILITGFGSALPEIYFAVISARKGEGWMVLGDLMGAVIIPATLVLGIVSLICPIKAESLPSFAIARIFLIISAVFFLIAVRTDKKITKKEGVFLLLIYILFIITELYFKD